MQNKKGLFITFEGIDGSGKTNQFWLLHKYIWNLNKYNHPIPTKEPYKDTDIRRILREDSDPYSQSVKLAELFVNDRRKHVKEIIQPFLENGLDVISDRYDLSTLAYQHTQGIELTKLIEMHKGLPVPDITYIIDVSVNIAVDRMRADKNSRSEKKFESLENKEFNEKLRQNYLKLADVLKDRNIVVIDGSSYPHNIFEFQIVPEYHGLLIKNKAKVTS